ncbi:hypothetical protein J7J74_00970 [bacterium]|nr:hypothetical protein [bacterium]
MDKLSENLLLQKIKSLYYEKKLSTREVAEELNISRWRVIHLMRKNNLKLRNYKEANLVRFLKSAKSFKPKSRLSLLDQKLKIAGIMLYWAEGAKRNPNRRWYTLDFANSNPEMIKLFLKFLREICGVSEEKLRVYLYCFDNQDIEELKRYWSRVTNIPSKQFLKPYIRKSLSSHANNKMPYGLVHIRYCDKRLFMLIEKWIKEYLRELNI